MDFEPLFDHPIHPSIARAAQYFHDISADHELPRRRDFRPARVRSLLGHIFLIDVLPEENDYKYSLYGVHMTVLYGEDLTDTRISQMRDENLRTLLLKKYAALCAARTYQYTRGRYVWPNRSVDIQRLLVPMADNDGQLTTIFGIIVPDVPERRELLFAGGGNLRLEIDEQIDGPSKQA